VLCQTLRAGMQMLRGTSGTWCGQMHIELHLLQLLQGLHPAPVFEVVIPSRCNVIVTFRLYAHTSTVLNRTLNCNNNNHSL
jgi:hypothetical protein